MNRKFALQRFNISFRMGTYYPKKDDHCFNATECPLFWQHHKISIAPVYFTNEDYYHGVKIAAMTGMSFNILGVLVAALFLINGLYGNQDFVDDLMQMMLKEKLSVMDSYYDFHKMGSRLENWSPDPK